MDEFMRITIARSCWWLLQTLQQRSPQIPLMTDSSQFPIHYAKSQNQVILKEENSIPSRPRTISGPISNFKWEFAKSWHIYVRHSGSSESKVLHFNRNDRRSVGQCHWVKERNLPDASQGQPGQSRQGIWDSWGREGQKRDPKKVYIIVRTPPRQLAIEVDKEPWKAWKWQPKAGPLTIWKPSWMAM